LILGTLNILFQKKNLITIILAGIRSTSEHFNRQWQAYGALKNGWRHDVAFNIKCVHLITRLLNEEFKYIRPYQYLIKKELLFDYLGTECPEDVKEKLWRQPMIPATKTFQYFVNKK